MTSQIDDYVKRPMRYGNIDGLDELLLGFFWMGTTLLEALQTTSPRVSIWHHKATFFVCLAVLGIVLSYGRKALKGRITYRRTGYVKYREAEIGVWRKLLIATVAAVPFIIIFQHTKPHSFVIVAVVLASAAWGLVYALRTWMDAPWRWIVLGALIVAPPLVATLPLGHSWPGNFPYMLQGLIFSVSGAITLTLYLRRNPVPEQVAQ